VILINGYPNVLNFDISILYYLNSYTGFSHDFNRFMLFVSGSGLLKGEFCLPFSGGCGAEEVVVLPRKGNIS
jgi:hypothetical protein